MMHGRLLPNGRLVEIRQGAARYPDDVPVDAIEAAPLGTPLGYDAQTRRAIPHAALIAAEQRRAWARNVIRVEALRDKAVALGAAEPTGPMRTALVAEAQRLADEIASLRGAYPGLPG